MEKPEKTHQLEGDIKEISFGDVITFIEEPDDYESVILNIKPLSAAHITHNEEGEEKIYAGGSILVTDIKNIVDRWDLERIVKAFERGWGKTILPDTVQSWKDQIEKGPRKITKEDIERAEQFKKDLAEKLRKLRESR